MRFLVAINDSDPRIVEVENVGGALVATSGAGEAGDVYQVWRLGQHAPRFVLSSEGEFLALKTAADGQE